MTYRKIEVDGKKYYYSTGKSHVKIRELGAWPKDKISSEVCLKSEHPIVRPEHVANKIREVVNNA